MRPVPKLTAVLVAAMLMLAGCGLPSDDSPQNISLNDIHPELRPGQLPTPTPVPVTSADLGKDQVFMIGPDNRLIPVLRPVADDPLDLLQILLNGTEPEENAVNITSALPARSARVQGVQLIPAFELATVDLAPGSLDIGDGSEQKLAFAQLVYTVTSLPGIESVVFTQSDLDDPRDDENPPGIAVQTDTGTTEPGRQVSRSDFDLVGPAAAAIVFDDIPTPTPTVAEDGIPIVVWKVRDLFRDESGFEIVGPTETLQDRGAIAGSQLVAVPRDVKQLSPESVIESLLTGTQSADRPFGLRSALPPDAFVNSVVVTPYEVPSSSGPTGTQTVRIATVDFAPASLPLVTNGDERLLAAGQVVLTLVRLAEVDQVTFSLDGQPIRLPIDSGLSPTFDPDNPQGMTASDFATLAAAGSNWEPGAPPPAPTPAPVVEPTPTPGG